MKRVPEVEVLEKMIVHIEDEYNLFYTTGTLLFDLDNPNHSRASNFLFPVKTQLRESFIHHYRVIANFLFDDRYYQTRSGSQPNNYITNIFAQDYLGESSKSYLSSPQIRIMKIEMHECRIMANNYVAQFSTDRLLRSSELDIPLMVFTIAFATLSFYELLPNNIQQKFNKIQRESLHHIGLDSQFITSKNSQLLNYL